jgi:hypothetical protein
MRMVFPKAPVRSDEPMIKLPEGGGSNRTTSRKVFDAERKEVTDKLSGVNIIIL